MKRCKKHKQLDDTCLSCLGDYFQALTLENLEQIVITQATWWKSKGIDIEAIESNYDWDEIYDYIETL